MLRILHCNIFVNTLFNIMKIFVYPYAFYILFINQQINAFLLKCPFYQMHLQKVVGFRPSLEYMTIDNLLYKEYTITNANSTRKDNRLQNHFQTDDSDLSEATNTNNHIEGNSTRTMFLDTISNICWRLCYNNENCIAYVHLLKDNECYGYTYFERSDQNLMKIFESSLPLIADSDALFYEKSCLNVPKNCNQRLWILTKLPGNSLIYQGKKTLPTLVTRRKCAEACLFEKEFHCLSASFAPSHRNNRIRSFQMTTTNAAKEHQFTLGRCLLSEKDKMMQPDAFRAASYEEEYIENQCYDRQVENLQCSYELYANSKFIYADSKIVGLTQQECQTYCSRETKFFCQGVSFYYEDTISASECLLHSEDIISLGPRSLQFRNNSIYMRRVKCLNVQVTCTPNEMLVKYTPKDWFRGKLYVSGHSKFCTIKGNGTRSIVLILPIGNETVENRCGILRAYEVTHDHQRIFISTLVVIQNNPNVQTQGDRLVKVGCIVNNATKSTSNNYKIVPMAQQNNFANTVMLENGNMPNAFALKSSLNISKSLEDSLLYNDSMPAITLDIIDVNRNKSTNSVQLGQYLQLQVVAEYTEKQLRVLSLGNVKPLLPDFKITSIIAKTNHEENYILLIDKHGCPTDPTIFPALKQLRSPTQNILYTKFRAFKFEGTTNVKFEIKIHICNQTCPLYNCLNINNYLDSRNFHVPKQHRQRRNHLKLKGQNEDQSNENNALDKFVSPDEQNPIYLATIMQIPNRMQFNASRKNANYNTSKNDEEAIIIPLDFNLYVHSPNYTTANSLVNDKRGEKAHMANSDDRMQLNNISVNQSIVAAILILWLIIQVALLFSCCFVIQKYKRLALMETEKRKVHENFHYLENRRVHWADF